MEVTEYSRFCVQMEDTINRVVGKDVFGSDVQDGRRRKQAAEMLHKHGSIYTEGIGIDFGCLLQNCEEGQS